MEDEGELVFTTLTKEGIPLLRYRTRDITSLNYEPCECECSFVRMNRITARSDDIMIIRGVNVYPMQIEKVLLSFEEVTPNYTLTIDRKGNLDQLTISAEMKNSIGFYGKQYLEVLQSGFEL